MYARDIDFICCRCGIAIHIVFDLLAPISGHRTHTHTLRKRTATHGLCNATAHNAVGGYMCGNVIN